MLIGLMEDANPTPALTARSGHDRMAESSLAEVLKRCSRCSEIKRASRENFSFIKCRDKWHSWCKQCCAEDRRADRVARPDHYKAIQRATLARHRPARLERGRQRYHATKDVNLERGRKNRVAKKDIYNANRRAKRARNLVAARTTAKTRREANLAAYRGYAKRAWANATPQRKLRNYFTSAICHSLNGKTKGGRSWEGILGYSADDLRSHLERQFTPDMTWDNYGDWHVDHIIPVTSFTFTSADDADFKACWAISNLRPLWAVDNLSKSDRRTLLL
jgi:hypothetical protein